MAEETYDPQSAFEQIFKQEKYRNKLAQMALEGGKSIILNFADIIRFDTELAHQLVEFPDKYLPYAQNAAYHQLGIEDQAYADQIKEMTVRILDLYQMTPLRDIGSKHMGKMIMVSGVVIRASYGRPKITNASFECRRCGTRWMVIQKDPSATFLKKPIVCANESCRSVGPFEYIEEESEFIDQQEIWIQESPDELPPGQMPRSLELKLYEDLVNLAHPGDTVAIVGVVRSLPRKVKGGILNTVDVFVDVNSVKVLGKEPETVTPSPEDMNSIQELAKDPFVQRKIVSSIAPSIYGYEHIKEAIAYLLFGGVPKELPDIKIRGELNVLLIGDPGTAKSQLLQYVARLAQRAIFTSGKGSSGVGLTASVVKDQETGGYMLEAGALVLADRGTACIDELEKMDEKDREAIHETLEQRKVTVAKAGIYAVLNARCGVLAAANPLLGRYNAYATIIENISLPVTLLSRFDLIFLMTDVPEVQRDTDLSKHILNIHAGAIAQPTINNGLLKKYINFAKQLKPQLLPEAVERIQQFYLQMRKASTEAEGSPLAIGPRQLEALARLSEARARMSLREKVTAEDAEAAINIMMVSLREVGIDLSSGKFDIDIIMTGKPKNTRDKMNVIIKCLVELEKTYGMVEEEMLREKLEKDYGIASGISARLLEQLKREGVIFEPKEGYVKKT